jgi:hypothetical protein
VEAVRLLASALLLLVATSVRAASPTAPTQGSSTNSPAQGGPPGTQGNGAGTPQLRTNLDLVVPVPPVEHERLHFFAPGDRHVVPGTVTINRAPYECDLDHVTFREREQFVAHLRSAHHMPVDRIPDTLVVIDGRVHFVGE